MFNNTKSCTDSSSDDPDVAMDSAEEESAVETDHKTSPTTPNHSAKHDKTMDGRVTKRASPRKGKKTNYKTLVDRFFAMDAAKDANGDNVFGEPSATESEDTYATDGSQGIWDRCCCQDGGWCLDGLCSYQVLDLRENAGRAVFLKWVKRRNDRKHIVLCVWEPWNKYSMAHKELPKEHENGRLQRRIKDMQGNDLDTPTVFS